jgi:hypothetical protein
LLGGLPGIESIYLGNSDWTLKSAVGGGMDLGRGEDLGS